MIGSFDVKKIILNPDHLSWEDHHYIWVIWGCMTNGISRQYLLVAAHMSFRSWKTEAFVVHLFYFTQWQVYLSYCPGIASYFFKILYRLNICWTSSFMSWTTTRLLAFSSKDRIHWLGQITVYETVSELCFSKVYESIFNICVESDKNCVSMCV